MNPCCYRREKDAAKYAMDLQESWPKVLRMTFRAVPFNAGFSVMATDERARRYYVTARPASLGSVNFIVAGES